MRPTSYDVATIATWLSMLERHAKALTNYRKATISLKRRWALAELVYATGRRFSDLVSMTPDDLDTHRLAITIGGDPIPVTPKAVEAIGFWLDSARGIWGRNPALVFHTYQGHDVPLTAVAANHDYARCRDEIGFHLSLPALRRAFITEMRARGMGEAQLDYMTGPWLKS